ncbi:MAG: 3-dehydroquinate synthase [Lachnospiraceae bacterium]|jgi:3-dehydroquinate synthase|nr:3-dehydroquinate synthase [Lachnospiraceae bacterium]MEE3460852.1 3-dehydroquinate synthase [Lachnospiraceae bacterium]
MSIVNVDLKKTVDFSYEIEIGYSLMDRLVRDLKSGLVGRASRIAIITDSNVADIYAGPIAERLTKAGYRNNVFVFPAGEKSKVRSVKEKIEDAMIDAGYKRDSLVIAVGGGVVSDLAGFTAGTFARGIPFINYATTLLAAADASVGGKTAVDTPKATNLIGLFHQPAKVYIDIACWKTLPDREIASGLAETIKHACMADRDFFAFLEKHIDDILRLDKEACEHIALRNCQIKDAVVSLDEKENSLREILNLGHTVGRAVETESNYRLLHGEAVSIGLVAETHLAKRCGFMTEAEAERVKALLERAGLPVSIPDYIDKAALLDRLYTDKKVRNDRLRFVLQDHIGAVVEFAPDVFSTEVSRDEAREILKTL